MLYRAEYAIHVRFHTSFRDQKEKMAFSANIKRYFILFRFGEKNRSFILGGYIEGNYGIFFGQESPEQVFSFFSRDWPIRV